MRVPIDDHAGIFPPTRWTLVLAAQRDPSLRGQVFEDLLRPRWKALYVLARKHGLGPASAEDAVQSFVARLLEDAGGADLVARLDPSQGSLRAYLRTAFRNHLLNLREGERAAKRGGGERPADLSEVETWLSSPDPSAEALFDRAWAVALFEDALGALEAEFVAGARRGPFEVVRELFAFGATPAYVELAARHGMSLSQLKAFVHRTKGRFRELVRARVERTLAADDDLDEEVRRLIEVLAG